MPAFYAPTDFLYGGRGWLVAHVDGLPEMRLWRLDRIISIDLLDRGFKRREDFDLMAYATQSFGVFQEDPIDVALRFTTEAAGDASGWLFHPSQAMEHEKDGALTVAFIYLGRCGDDHSTGRPQGDDVRLPRSIDAEGTSGRIAQRRNKHGLYIRASSRFRACSQTVQ